MLPEPMASRNKFVVPNRICRAKAVCVFFFYSFRIFIRVIKEN